jgi:hypothetical protein
MHNPDDARPPLLRFVVLRHEGIDEPHFDLMFETSPGSPLATWRADTWPVTTNTRLTPLPDHRADFLTYEGPLAGNRGDVRRIAEGICQLITDTPTVLTVQMPGGALRLPRIIAADAGT